MGINAKPIGKMKSAFQRDKYREEKERQEFRKRLGKRDKK